MDSEAFVKSAVLYAAMTFSSNVTDAASGRASEMIRHLALLYNIHRYNLAMLSFMKAKAHVIMALVNFAVCEDFRNFMMHGDCIQESKQDVLATVLMKEIMPYELSRLMKSRSHLKVVDQADIHSLLALGGINILQSIVLSSNGRNTAL